MELTTSEKILDAAQSLVVAGGYNGFSYADISEAVGIRKASIHHHFPTKAALVAALVRRYTGRALEGLGALSAHVPAPEGRLDAYLGYWEKCVVDDAEPFCVCAMLASEMPLLPDEVASEVRRHFRNLAEWLAALLRAGIEAGAFRPDIAAEAEAQILVASVHGALLSARALGEPALFKAIVGAQAARLRR
jgi:TetR/AcrR family transcriptional repressor of nem operon